MLLKDKLDRRVFILLWLVVLFRLLIVDSITSPVSFSQFLPEPQKIEKYIATQQTTDIQVNSLPSQNQQTAISQPQPPINRPKDTPATPIPILFSVWLVGATAMITGTIILFLLFQFKSRNIIYLGDFGHQDILGNTKVYLSDQVTSPVTIGIFKPVIHLPDTIDFTNTQMVRHVLTHEMTHIKRYDNLLKLVMLIALSLHWFNPFVWLLSRTLTKDIECSCDVATLALIGSEKKGAYATTLMTMAEKSSVTNVAGLVFASFESSFLQERVRNIMQAKSSKALSIAFALVFSLSIFAVFATNAPPLEAMTNTPLISEQKAKDIAQAYIGSNQIVKFKKDTTLGLVKYAVAIRTDDILHEVAIDAYDGSIIQYEKKIETVPQAQPDKMLTQAQASEKALNLVTNGTIIKSKLNVDKKGTRYDFTVIKDQEKYEIDVDIYTGEITKFEKKNITEFNIKQTKEMLSPQQATAIALKQTTGIIIKCTLDYKKEYGLAIYDIDVIKDDFKYKYHINAYNGDILKTEIDYSYNDNSQLKQ